MSAVDAINRYKRSQERVAVTFSMPLAVRDRVDAAADSSGVRRGDVLLVALTEFLDSYDSEDGESAPKTQAKPAKKAAAKTQAKPKPAKKASGARRRAKPKPEPEPEPAEEENFDDDLADEFDGDDEPADESDENFDDLDDDINFDD